MCYIFLLCKMRQNPAVNAFKVWIFPSLVSLLGLMIWNDVSEIKADVKALMAQSNIDKTRIDNLERIIFKSTEPIKTSFNGLDRSVAILPNNNFETKKKANEKVL